MGMRARVCFLLVAGVALLVPASAAQATFPGANGKIAYIKLGDLTPGDHIYTINPDGTEDKRLTPIPVDYDTAVSWSPDGRKVAFTSSSNGQIYTINADGSDAKQLTSDEDINGWPSWSPDGKQIAFASGLGPLGIHRMNADGSHATLLTTVPGFDPAWSPDGRIAFIGYGDLWVMKADGTDVANLTPGYRRAWYPDWSPDGTKIAFTEHPRIEAWDTTAGWFVGLKSSVPFFSQDTGPSWSPDGKQIAFASDRNATSSGWGYNKNIWTMKADGSDPVPVTLKPTDVLGGEAEWFPAWQPLSEAPDSDGDGVPDRVDNCPHEPNTEQVDGNGDGVGDACAGPRRSDFKNASKFCKAEREFLGQAEFSKRYGTNGSDANAHGKCVTANK
jgi:Tol biopolymer transport system component